jgi:hypothetical protein
MTTLKYDYKRTAIDLAGYEAYQDLNNPKNVLLTKLETTGDVTQETYAMFTVYTSNEFSDVWGNRTIHTYRNLIDLFSENN